jgi:Domain of unknown function (DUF4440)
VTAFEHELIDVERAGWEALCTPEGAAYYRAHLTDDAVMAFPFGVLTGEEALAAIESAEPWARFEMIDPRVIALGRDSGIVVYSVEAQREGQEPFRAVISSAFTRIDGEWKLACHQQSFG